MQRGDATGINFRRLLRPREDRYVQKNPLFTMNYITWHQQHGSFSLFLDYVALITVGICARAMYRAKISLDIYFIPLPSSAEWLG